ncbi:MAG: winged helix-turn-helix domain-containing protein [Pseudomonadales bacterium]|nr:winged helix-turn-helix domain-containing protein [Lewinella sp.]MCB1730379.1 winged helix-turn-helix domain-containing protein [Halieaceae bacterium]MCP5190845.1 winged helix-turn-helix domain-containing protein [Pseudomonadales bacterium]
MADYKSVFLFGPFALDPEAGLYRDERLVRLPPKELALLKLLVQLKGQVASHMDIEQQLWPDRVVSYAALARCVYSLRRLLGPEGKKLIETVPKRGYRLAVAVRKFEPPRGETALSQSISGIPLAYSHYFAGAREANDPRPAGQARAIMLFEEAAKVDPAFAAAHAAVADTRMYQVIRGFLHPRDGLELGLRACRQALDINPRLVQGLAARGWFEGVMMQRYDAAHACLDKALTIDRGYSRAYAYRSWVFRCQGKSQHSVTAIRKAVEMDPHALLNRHSLCTALFCAGGVEEALGIERELRRQYPQDDIAQGFFALFAAYLGHTREALVGCSAALQLSADLPVVCAAMAYVLARAGKLTEARDLAASAYAATLPRAPRPMLAAVYVELGEEQHALALLQEAREERCPYFAPARIDPRFAKLKRDRKFAALFK